MKTATVTLEGTAPLVQGRQHNTPKTSTREGGDDYERRTWREKTHYDENGECYLMPLALKNALYECAKYLSMQIPGKGKATYTKHFEAGVLVADPAYLGVSKDKIEGEWRSVPADGIKGSGKRVPRCFPILRKWSITVPVMVLDDTITKEVFEHHLAEAGKFIGLGSFRPRKGGIDGRFKVTKVVWS